MRGYSGEGVDEKGGDGGYRNGGEIFLGRGTGVDRPERVKEDRALRGRSWGGRRGLRRRRFRVRWPGWWLGRDAGGRGRRRRGGGRGRR